jgi:hypothetical protein
MSADDPNDSSWAVPPAETPPGGLRGLDPWGQHQHLYLKFDKQFSEFEAYGEQGGCQVRGKRLAPIGVTP